MLCGQIATQAHIDTTCSHLMSTYLHLMTWCIWRTKTTIFSASNNPQPAQSLAPTRLHYFRRPTQLFTLQGDKFWENDQHSGAHQHHTPPAASNTRGTSLIDAILSLCSKGTNPPVYAKASTKICIVAMWHLNQHRSDKLFLETGYCMHDHVLQPQTSSIRWRVPTRFQHRRINVT